MLNTWKSFPHAKATDPCDRTDLKHVVLQKALHFVDSSSNAIANGHVYQLNG